MTKLLQKDKITQDNLSVKGAEVITHPSRN